MLRSLMSDMVSIYQACHYVPMSGQEYLMLLLQMERTIIIFWNLWYATGEKRTKQIGIG